MIVDLSVAIEDAERRGLVRIAAGARVARDVLFVPQEDDGTSRGVSTIEEGALVRSGVVVCSGVSIGAAAVIGLRTILRVGARVGSNSVISHGVCVERDVHVGAGCRVSALTHLTGGCMIEDNVQVGARVVTINDKEMRWREGAMLRAPILRKGSRVGSGVSLLAGVEIGEGSIIGAGSVVTRSVPPHTMAWGVPAYVHRDL